jgi:hypothetical protein
MKKNILNYWLSLFFILLLFAKDIIIVFPSLFVPDSAVTAVHIDWTEEESERNRSGEEVSRSAASEYLNADHHLNLEPPLFHLPADKIPAVNSFFQTTFYGSVPTPPPDKA